MKTIDRAILIFCGIALLFSTSAHAQRSASSPVSIDKIEFDDVDSPNYSVKANGAGSGSASASNMDWLGIEVQFENELRWLDGLTLEYSVILEAASADDVGPTGKKLNMFTGQVSYANIAEGKKWHSAMYLDPHTFKRYGKVRGVFVQAKIGGKVVAEAVEPSSRKKWWEEYPATPGVLLRKNQTPFIHVNTDSFPIIKQP